MKVFRWVGRSAVVVMAVGLLTSAGRASTVNYIYNFTNGTVGSHPTTGIVAGPKGGLFGATTNTVYHLSQKVSGTWAVTPIYAGALSGLTGSVKALYGFTAGVACAPSGRPGGAVAMLLPPAAGQTSWAMSTIYTFRGGKDGAMPSAMSVAADGSLVGTTVSGGGSLACGSTNGVGVGCGTVFRLTEANGVWKEALVHAYQGGKDGEFPLPQAAPSFDAAGNVFVTTEQGGASAANTIRSCVGNGVGEGFSGSSPLVFFAADCAELALAYLNASIYIIPSKAQVAPAGSSPFSADAAAIITGQGGGHTNDCPNFGNNGCGAVGLYTQPANGQAPWTQKILHEFSGPDGASPAGALTPSGTNTLFGLATTLGGKCTNVGYGLGGCGAIYKLVQGASGWAWGGTVYRFPGGTRGTNPVPRLLSHNSVLLGTTTYGGSAACGSLGCGTIFALHP